MLNGLQEHAATVATIAAVGPSSGNEFLPTKADATVAAISSNNCYFCLINEHGYRPR